MTSKTMSLRRHPTRSIHPPTMNDSVEPNHTILSTVQFHTQPWPAKISISGKYARFADTVLC